MCDTSSSNCFTSYYVNTHCSICRCSQIYPSNRTMYCHVWVTYLSSVPYRTTELQCTGISKYGLAAASGLCSGQFVELERSVYWKCDRRSVSNRSGSVCLGCDVRMCCSRRRERGTKRETVPHHSTTPSKPSHRLLHITERRK